MTPANMKLYNHLCALIDSHKEEFHDPYSSHDSIMIWREPVHRVIDGKDAYPIEWQMDICISGHMVTEIKADSEEDMWRQAEEYIGKREHFCVASHNGQVYETDCQEVHPVPAD